MAIVVSGTSATSFSMSTRRDNKRINSQEMTMLMSIIGSNSSSLPVKPATN